MAKEKQRFSHLPIVVADGFSPVPLFPRGKIKKLRKQGLDIHLVEFRLEDMRDTETFAQHIDDTVRQCAKLTDRGQVNLVGLSMGGVAGLHAIKRHGIAPLVHTFIACGSPFHGSLYSWFVIPTLIFANTGYQLSPGSPYLTKLLADPLPQGPRYTCIVGSDDDLVKPHAARFPGATVIERKFSHTDIFLKHWVHELFLGQCH